VPHAPHDVLVLQLLMQRRATVPSQFGFWRGDVWILMLPDQRPAAPERSSVVGSPIFGLVSRDSTSMPSTPTISEGRDALPLVEQWSASARMFMDKGRP